MTDEAVLVLDVGTSTSAAALVTPGRVRLVKEPGGGTWTWPSVAAWDGESIRVGSRAEHRKRTHPAAVREEFKRDLGSSVPLRLGDAEFRPEELTAALIAAAKNEAERLHGQPVTRAVITCPASYRPGDPRRALLVAAGESAGLVAVDLLAEPVAAALAPVAGTSLGPGDTVLVYDFGGGTFDAAVVRLVEGGRHEVLGSTALDDCGGADIDRLLYEEILALSGDKLTQWATDDRRELELRDFVRTVKHRLSTEDVEDYFSPAGLPVEVPRARLTQMIGPLVDRTIVCCRDLLDRCALRPDELTSVLLVGGATRTPAVAAAVALAFGGRVRQVEDPDLAVVQGGAVWAGQSSDRFSVADRPRSGAQPLSWELPSGSGTLLRWNVAVGDEFAADAVLGLVRLSDGDLWEIRADDRPGRIAALHADARQTVRSGDWLVTVGTGRRGRPRRRALFVPPVQVEEFVAAHTVRLSPDGRRFAALWSGGAFRMFSIGEAEPLWAGSAVVGYLTFDAVGEEVLYVLPGGSLTTGTQSEYTIAARAVATGEELWTLPVVGRSPLASVRTPGDEPSVTLVDRVDDHTRIRTWSGSTGELNTVRTSIPLDGSLRFDTAGRVLVYGRYQFVHLYDAASGLSIVGLGIKGSVRAVALTGETLQVAIAADGVHLWDPLSGDSRALSAGTSPVQVAVSPDETHVAASSESGHVWLWELDSGRLVQWMLHSVEATDKAAPEGQHRAGVQDLVFGPDSRSLLLATDRSVARWEF